MCLTGKQDDGPDRDTGLRADRVTGTRGADRAMGRDGVRARLPMVSPRVEFAWGSGLVNLSRVSSI